MTASRGGHCKPLSGLEPSPEVCAIRVPVGTCLRGGDGRAWCATRSKSNPGRVYWQLHDATPATPDLPRTAAGASEHSIGTAAASVLEAALLRARAAGVARAALKRVDPYLAAAADMLNVGDAAELARRRAGSVSDVVAFYFPHGVAQDRARA